MIFSVFGVRGRLRRLRRRAPRRRRRLRRRLLRLQRGLPVRGARLVLVRRADVRGAVAITIVVIIFRASLLL